MPGVWHHKSTVSDIRMFRLACEPLERVPTGFEPPYPSVVDGFLVTADNALIGSMPHLCAANDPTNGIDSELQLGLKSDASENAHLFSMQSAIGGYSFVPIT